jgi:hypothetical protein
MKLVNSLAALMLMTCTAFSQPTEVKAFEAEKVKDAALLTWTVAAQSTVSHFEIQRSDDGSNWTTIALVFSFEDNSIEHAYKFSDKTLKQPGAIYRLRQVDTDKKETFSEMKTAGTTAAKR